MRGWWSSINVRGGWDCISPSPTPRYLQTFGPKDLHRAYRGGLEFRVRTHSDLNSIEVRYLDS